MGNVTVLGLLLCFIVVTCAANRPPSLSGKVVSRVIAKVGKNTKLLCPADSDPDLTEWKKNGQVLKPGWDRFRVSRDGNLRIRDVQLSDAGLYTCVATNGFGSMNINYTVIVLDEENNVFQEADKLIKQSPGEDIYKEGTAPVFAEVELEKMREFMLLYRPKGSTLRLSCKAEGNPPPQVRWYKDSEPYNQRRPHSTLKIHGVTGKDSGKYMCVARNRLGQMNFTYSINIIDVINQVPKLIAPHPLNQTVFPGDSVSFQCYIESVVEPEIKWLKLLENPEELKDSNLKPFKYKDQNYLVWGTGILQSRRDGSYLNKLVIKRVRRQNAGMFVCLATNRKGFVSRHAYLKIGEDHAISKHQPTSGVSSEDPSIPDSQNSSHSSNDTNLPLLIGLPACALLIIILITVFLLQRNNRCRRSSTNTKVPRTPVPPAEREAYYYSNCQQHHLQQSVNPLLMSRDKLPKTPTPSVDMTGSEFSSVSRTHHPHHFYSHNNHNYGY